MTPERANPPAQALGPTAAPAGPPASGPRVLLIEFFNAERFPGQIAQNFPLMKGYFDRVGVPARWLRFGMASLHLLVRGADEVTLAPAELGPLLDVAAELRPDWVFSTHALAADVVWALRQRLPQVQLELRQNPFLVFGESADPDPRARFLAELDRPDFRPDYRGEPGNEAARRLAQHNVYVLLPGRCGYARSVMDNPRYRGVVLPPETRDHGCAFCGCRGGSGRQAPEAVDSPEDDSDRVGRWLDRQIAGIAATLGPDRLPQNILVEQVQSPKVLRRLVAALARHGLRGRVGLQFGVRADHLLHSEAALRELLAEARGTSERLGVYACGIESFSPATLDLYNKGTTPLQNLCAVNLLAELVREFPDNLSVTGLSLIVFHPWAVLEDLQRDLRLVRRLGLVQWFGNLFESRLRLHGDLAVTALAAHDGLIEPVEDDPALHLNRWKLFESEAAWRFSDPRLRPLSRVALRLRQPALQDPLARHVVAALRAHGLAEGQAQGLDGLLDLLVALVDVARAAPAPLAEETLLAEALALYGSRAARHRGAQARAALRVGETRWPVDAYVTRLATLVLRAAKPTAVLSALSAPAFEAAQAAAARVPGLLSRVLPRVAGRPATLVLARDPALLDARAARETALATALPGPARAAAERERAVLDGVPDCCAAASPYAALRGSAVAWALLRQRQLAPGPVPAAPLPLWAPDLAFVPCRADCPAAAARLREWLAAFDVGAAALAAERAYVFGLDDDAWVALDPCAADDAGFDYEPAALGPGDEPLRALLRTAGRIEVGPAQLRVRQGADSVGCFTAELGVWHAARTWAPAEWAELARGVLLREAAADPRPAERAPADPSRAAAPDPGAPSPPPADPRPAWARAAGTLCVRLVPTQAALPEHLFFVGRVGPDDRCAWREGDIGLFHPAAGAAAVPAAWLAACVAALREAAQAVAVAPDAGSWPRWKAALATALRRAGVLRGFKCQVSRLGAAPSAPANPGRDPEG